MDSTPAKAVVIAFVLTAASPVFDEGTFDLPLGSQAGAANSRTVLSFGSVGLDPHAGASYVPEKGSDPFHFNIPSERPFQSVPGFVVKIPFGYSSNE